ncbi:hypothetical protein [Sphingobacterium arenae]|uniref:Uncharacterized protein n=1 Tax=Sphingobacterium arenae TaxID=1280598 RepID=A0ABR7Y306_9SPHI|nr:hypothetical protein [Sphingobacterium arenae]MBD1425641.1 hypothetical protein [Sphingobacterium arenae]
MDDIEALRLLVVSVKNCGASKEISAGKKSVVLRRSTLCLFSIKPPIATLQVVSLWSDKT